MRANVLTRFNAILGALLVVILVVGPLQDALFGIVLVTNTAIGIVQEMRAKRSLDRLALLTAPKARVVRDGSVVEVALEAIVLDDVLEVNAGDQIVVDGKVLLSEHLEIDESLLTGEAEPLVRREGDQLLSGSFVVAGNGRFQATRIGREAYAVRLAAEARSFQLVRSELRVGIDRILRIVTWLIGPVSILLISSQLTTHATFPEAIRGSVAGIGSMIPEGLVLLTSVAFAAGVVRLSRRRVLVQELSAIEVLARVDVVCLDKTGTLTENDLSVREVEVLEGHERPEILAALGALAASEARPNATLRAIASDPAVSTSSATPPVASVPFSSARRWSAAEVTGIGTWLLGAPDVVAERSTSEGVRHRLDTLRAEGGRVVLLARSPHPIGDDQLLDGAEPAAIVVLEERIRDEARATLDYFADQGVRVKVISGDHPETVAAVARRVGLDPGVAVDARTLPDDRVALARAVEDGTVFGRVTPHQKRAMISALQSNGHVVAMTGDGVNDVLALKIADLGVAMASGSPASRSVAPVVLLDNSFAGLPAVLAEGRRVIANIEAVANLFVTKTVYATLLALAVGVAQLPFPFLPRHLTVISSLTIGVPAFFLALAPNTTRARPGFVARVLRFAVPAGTIAAAATFGGYSLARSDQNLQIIQARTSATIVLFAVGLWVLAILARPWTTFRRLLVAGMVAAFGVILLTPALRRFFDLEIPSALVLFAVIGVVSLAIAALEAGWRLTRWLGSRWPRT